MARSASVLQLRARGLREAVPAPGARGGERVHALVGAAVRGLRRRAARALQLGARPRAGVPLRPAARQRVRLPRPLPLHRPPPLPDRRAEAAGDHVRPPVRELRLLADARPLLLAALPLQLPQERALRLPLQGQIQGAHPSCVRRSVLRAGRPQLPQPRGRHQGARRPRPHGAVHRRAVQRGRRAGGAVHGARPLRGVRGQLGVARPGLQGVLPVPAGGTWRRAGCRAGSSRLSRRFRERPLQRAGAAAPAPARQRALRQRHHLVVRPGAEQRRAETGLRGLARLSRPLSGAQPLPLRLPRPRQGARAAGVQRLQPLPPHRQPARVRQHRRAGGLRAHRRAHGEDRQLLRVGRAAAAHVQRPAPHAGVSRYLLLQSGAWLQGHLQLHQELRRELRAADGRVPVRVRLQQQRGARRRLRQPQLPGLLPARHRVPLLLPRARAREGAPSLQLLRRRGSAPVRGDHGERLRRVLQLHGARPQVFALLRPTQGAGHRVRPEVLPGDVPLQRPPGRHRLQRLLPLSERAGCLLRQTHQQKRRRVRSGCSMAVVSFINMPGPSMVGDENNRQLLCIPTILVGSIKEEGKTTVLS